MKVFLGGTCNNSTWRDILIPKLDANNIKYFNPVVEDWTPECKEIEDYEKHNMCDTHVYVITPKQTGFYSFAEIIDSAAFGYNVIFVYAQVDEDLRFSKSQINSLDAIASLLLTYDTGESYITTITIMPPNMEMLMSTLADILSGKDVYFDDLGNIASL